MAVLNLNIPEKWVLYKRFGGDLYLSDGLHRVYAGPNVNYLILDLLNGAVCMRLRPFPIYKIITDCAPYEVRADLQLPGVDYIITASHLSTAQTLMSLLNGEKCTRKTCVYHEDTLSVWLRE